MEIGVNAKISFTRHIFFTGTYSRTNKMEICWTNISKDYNRFQQSFRRLHNHKVQYLRVVERHKDGFPHVHSILQMQSANIRIENNRYFDRTLYKTWKTLWKHGHSDYQKPRKSGSGTLFYILKYLIKNTTKTTIFSKMYPKSERVQVVVTHSEPFPKTSPSPVYYQNIKLATWSRNFNFKPFMIVKTIEPCPKPNLLHE